jgi:hypothetical protein
MTTSVKGIRFNKAASMDIDQIREWAKFMDRALIVSVLVTIVAVAALGIATWMSFRFNGAVRAHEQAAFNRYKDEMGRHAVQLEQDVSAARNRTITLEEEVSAARRRSEVLEQEASRSRERAVALEQAAGEARERAAQESRERATAVEKARTLEMDAAEIQQRVAKLGEMVRQAAEQKRIEAQGSAVETSHPAHGLPETAAESRDGQPPQARLARYAGTPAAVYVLDQVSDAPAVGAMIVAYLNDAGWAPQTWTWAGVGGIVGVVVLTREGSDPATHEAASAVVEALRSEGFNATKGDWPADWRRFRGVLNGPQAPGPTEAPIRIVVGAKAR